MTHVKEPATDFAELRWINWCCNAFFWDVRDLWQSCHYNIIYFVCGCQIHPVLVNLVAAFIYKPPILLFFSYRKTVSEEHSSISKEFRLALKDILKVVSKVIFTEFYFSCYSIKVIAIMKLLSNSLLFSTLSSIWKIFADFSQICFWL